jgi:hypothetical protein
MMFLGLFCKQGVTGSIPVTSTNFLFILHCPGCGRTTANDSAVWSLCPILCPPSLAMAVNTASSDG